MPQSLGARNGRAIERLTASHPRKIWTCEPELVLRRTKLSTAQINYVQLVEYSVVAEFDFPELAVEIPWLFYFPKRT